MAFRDLRRVRVSQGMLRFFVLFMLLLLGLFSLRITNVVRDAVTLPFTGVLADTSAFLITLFDKDVVTHGVVPLERKYSSVSVASGSSL